MLWEEYFGVVAKIEAVMVAHIQIHIRYHNGWKSACYIQTQKTKFSIPSDTGKAWEPHFVW